MRKLLLFIALAIVFVSVVSIQVFASQTEGQDNNSVSKADTLYVNTEMVGNISGILDADWYCFTITQDGYINITLDHELKNSTTKYWEVFIYDSTGTEIVDGTGYGSTVSGKQNYKSANYGLKAGTYYVKVTASGYNYWSTPYYLKVNFTNSNYWETENNNDKNKADVVALNKTYTGALTRSNDVDWYKFTLEQDGYIQLDFSHEILDSTKTHWNICFYDETGVNYITGKEVYMTVTGKEDNKQSGSLGLSAGTYYMKVTDGSEHKNIDYKFKLNFTPTDYSEKENNSTFNDANQIQLNKEYIGLIFGSNDIDWYKFTTTEDGYFSVEFMHELIDSTKSYWRVYLYDSNGVDHFAGIDTYYSNTGKEPEMIMPEIGIPAGTYYIKITSSSYYYKADYKLKVNFTATNNYEKENNGGFLLSNEIDPYQTVKGSIWSSQDLDWYKFTVNYECEIALKFSHDIIDSTRAYWSVVLYKDNASTKLTSITVTGKETEEETKYVTLTPGTYYIKIAYSNYHSGITYALTVLEKHDCYGSFKIVKEATCTSTGRKEKHCNLCGKLMDSQSISKIEHSLGAWEIDKEATCSEQGSRHAICSVCGYKKVENISKLAHTLNEWTKVKDATCNEVGREERACSKCAYYEVRDIAKLVHQYSDWVVITEATCTTEGVEIQTCSLCQDKKERSIAKLDHTFGEWGIVSEGTCVEEGSEERVCKNCDTKETRKTSYGDHTYGEWIVVYPATCYELGLMKKVCVHCADEIESGIVQLEHSYSEYIVAVQPTCEIDGREESVCAHCHDTLTRTIPKIGHSFGEWEKVSMKEEQQTCQTCGHVETRPIDNSTAIIIASVAVLGGGAGVGVSVFLWKKRKISK